MKELGIDIETYSSFDLMECGVHRYVEAVDFTILLFSYKRDDDSEVRTVDLASGEELPGEIASALTDPDVVKTAYNAMFERTCLSKYLGVMLPIEQWRCTMVQAARMGLPLGLSACAEALGLPVNKMREGNALIRLFSTPQRKRRRTLMGEEPERVLPSENPEKWEIFKAYNKRDVEVEQAVLAKVRRFPVPEFDQRLYVLDQEINDRGVLLDRRLAENADRFYHTYTDELMERLRALTGLDNPNSNTQMKEWLKGLTGYGIDSLGKGNVYELERKLGRYPQAVEALRLRRELAKTSNAKYASMLDCVNDDGRIRGLFQFYGAARSGRWSGRLVQLQNLPQNHMKNLGDARNIVLRGDYDEFTLCYDKVNNVLSELIRTAFIAGPGCTLHVCDFSAIEARVVAWLAGEGWVLEAFRAGKDIYCETASQMFGVRVEKHGENAELRQKGKIAVLALGYGGAVNALDAMGGQRLGLSEEEEKDIVYKWRNANRNIVALWGIFERAAIGALKDPGHPKPSTRGITFTGKWGGLMVTLPSGRSIFYVRAQVIPEHLRTRKGEVYEKDGLAYEGVNQTTRQWTVIRTFGGKLTENIVQAVARDILGEILLRCKEHGFDVVFHVHDEVIVEAKKGQTLEELESLFSQPIGWCEDLPLKGAGYSTPYYLKD